MNPVVTPSQFSTLVAAWLKPLTLGVSSNVSLFLKVAFCKISFLSNLLHNLSKSLLKSLETIISIGLVEIS